MTFGSRCRAQVMKSPYPPLVQNRYKKEQGVPMTTDQTNASPGLDEAIAAAAQGLTTALGIVFMFASIAQALGWVQAGVPAWMNIAISAGVLVLAQLLPQKSLAVTAALGVIFLVLAVDTLMATGYVLDSWGVLPTIIVVACWAIPKRERR